MKTVRILAPIVLAMVATPAVRAEITGFAGTIGVGASPTAIAGYHGDLYYVTMATTSTLCRIQAPDCQVGKTLSAPEPIASISFASSRGLTGLAIDSGGTIYIAGDTGNTTTYLFKYEPDGEGGFAEDTTFHTNADSALGRISGGLALIGDNLLAVSDFTTGQILYIDSNGQQTGLTGATQPSSGLNYVREPIYNSADQVLYPLRNASGDDIMTLGYYSGISSSTGGGSWNSSSLIPDGSSTYTIQTQHGAYDAQRHQLVTLDSKANAGGSREIRLWDIASSGTALSLSQGIQSGTFSAGWSDIDDAVFIGSNLYVTSMDQALIYVYTEETQASVYTNSRIGVDFQKASGVEVGVEGRIEGASYYQLKLTGDDTLQLWLSDNGTTTLLAENSFAPSYVATEEWRLEMTLSGESVRGAIFDDDGLIVMRVGALDDTLASGTASTWSGTGATPTWGGLDVTTMESENTELENLSTAYDVIIAGAGTSGVMAAIQAARLGASVLLLDDTDYIGGQLAAAGVTSMDEGSDIPSNGIRRNGVRERGLYREFYENALIHYNGVKLSTDTCYIGEGYFAVEPRVARKLLYDMIQDTRLEHPGTRLDVSLVSNVTEVYRTGNTVTGVEIAVGFGDDATTTTIASHVLVDATELGDLLPLAGVDYRIGKWINNVPSAYIPNDCYDEVEEPAVAKVQDFTWTSTIRDYGGTPPSEFLFGAVPPGYDTRKCTYEKGFLCPAGIASDCPGSTCANAWTWEHFTGYRGMPDSTNAFPSTAFTPANPNAVVTRTSTNYLNDYPIYVDDITDASNRDYVEYRMKLRTLQMLYYISNNDHDPQTTWAIAGDESFDTPYNRFRTCELLDAHPSLLPFGEILANFPPRAYARESRRLIGLHTLKTREIDRRGGGVSRFPHAIAVGDYGLDMHGSKICEYIDLTLDNPSDLDSTGFDSDMLGPFQIPIECLIPETIDGFLAAEKNISQSRLVNGATRLQPSTMLIGQAAGALAALAANGDVQPRDVLPATVQDTLLGAGDVLFATRYDAHQFPGVEQYGDLWRQVQLNLLYGVLDPADNFALASWFVAGGTIANTSIDSDGGLSYVDSPATGSILLIEGRPFFDATLAPSHEDYTVSATINRVSGTGAVGIVGRYTDYYDEGSSVQEYFLAQVDGSTLELRHVLDGTGLSGATVGSAASGFTNGSDWTIEMTFSGTSITVSLYNSSGTLDTTFTATSQNDYTGRAGLRIANCQAAEVKKFAVTAPAGNTLYRSEFAEPVDIASDSLTRAWLATFIYREFLNDEAIATTNSFADVPVDHWAFAQIERVAAAGIMKGGGGDFDPDTVVTRAELAEVLYRALASRLPILGDGNSYTSVLLAQGIANSVFSMGSPTDNLKIEDYVNAAAEMIREDTLSLPLLYDPQTQIDREIEYVLSECIVAGSGAITTRQRSVANPGVGLINPYFAHRLCRGLLRADRPELDIVVKNWMNWFIDKIANPATDCPYADAVCDYSVDQYDVETVRMVSGVGHADSVDSYNSMFLLLAWEYYVYTGDDAWFFGTGVEANIEAVAAAVEDLQQSDSLTYAKPDYSTKYLMDNCEVWAGFDAMAKIEGEIYGDVVQQAHYEDAASDVANAIESNFWDATHQWYNWYKGSSGTVVPPDGATWNPDMLAQLWPQIMNVPIGNTARADALFTWVHDSEVVDTETTPAANFALAAVRLGKPQQVELMQSVTSFHTIDHSLANWHVGHSGQWIMANLIAEPYLTVDNDDPGYSEVGTWASSGTAGHFGSDSRYTYGSAGADTATWSFGVPASGDYDVYTWWTAATNRDAAAPYTVNHDGGSTPVSENQKTDGSTWNMLASEPYLNGVPKSVVLSDNVISSHVVSADAIRMLRVPDGVVLDNDEADKAGAWSTSTGVAGFLGADYYSTATGDSTKTVTWRLDVPRDGSYNLEARWTSFSNRTTAAQYEIIDLGGFHSFAADQSQNGGTWVSLGSVELYSGIATIVLRNPATAGKYTIADAVRLTPN